MQSINITYMRKTVEKKTFPHKKPIIGHTHNILEKIDTQKKNHGNYSQ